MFDVPGANAHRAPRRNPRSRGRAILQPSFLAAERAKPNKRRGTRMLVLSRKINETIIINDNIVITVVDIRGDKVRLGIEAPKDVPVHRQEVYDAIKRGEGAGGARRD